MRRILSLSLCLALVVTMCLCGSGEVFAGTQSGFSKEKADSVSDVTVQSVSGNLSFSDATKADMVKAEASVPVIPLNVKKVISSGNRQFKVVVPSTGYLTLTLVGLSKDPNNDYIYNVYARTLGFSDTVSFTNSRNNRVIAVKKGVYTFNVNSYGDYTGIWARFTKVKESKYGKKKSKAANIKKNKVKAGLMFTGAQKTHWYKIKNTKKHKLKITINSRLSHTGNYVGGIKVSFYKGKKCFGSNVIYDNEPQVFLYPYNTLGKKLTKGTYKLKIESYKKGTGYFNVKWK